MKKPFRQLYSIHAFIRSGSTTKQVPLCFIMMSQQKATDYKVVLQTIVDKIVEEHGSGKFNYVILLKFYKIVNGNHL